MQNEKNNTPNYGATTSEVDFITKTAPFQQNFENLPVEFKNSRRHFPVTVKLNEGANGELKKEFDFGGISWNRSENQKTLAEIGKRNFGTVVSDFLFFDFDNVVKDGDFINEKVEDFVNELQLTFPEVYIEYSATQTGLHCFLKPTDGKFGKITNGEKDILYFDKEQNAKLEIFYLMTSKFCLCTGDKYDDGDLIPKGESVDAYFENVLKEIKNQHSNLRELITPNVIVPAEKQPIKASIGVTDIYNTNYSTDPEFEQARKQAIFDCIPVGSLSDEEWFEFISSAKHAGFNYSEVDLKNREDPKRYNADENLKRWNSANDPSFGIQNLYNLAVRYGNFNEKEFRREYEENHKKSEVKKIFNSDEDSEKIIDWQKHNGEISPEVLKYLGDAKTYLENLKVEDITAGNILSSKTKYAVAHCLFYDFYSDVATNFLTRMKSAIQAAKAKVKSATVENPVVDEIKSLSSIRPSDFDKSVSAIVTETKTKHKIFLVKLNAEKAKERREQYEQAPSTTRTNCPDCPIDLVLPYQTSFEKNRGIFANDDNGRPKCISRTPIVPTRKFVNPAEGTYHYEIAINTQGDEWQKVIYDAESLFNAKNVMNLVNDGARFSSKTAADVSEWLTTILSVPENQEIIQKVDIYNQPGWTDETCTEFIYPQNEEKYLVRTKNFDYEKTFAKRGDKSEWLKMFKKVLDKSAVTRLTLGAALSAPLVNVLNVRNLQLHLSCPSGNGKSALVKFATSTYGNPEKFKFKFNGTSNSFETQSTLFNDLPSWLEELQSANKKQRENIDQVIYDYESGIGRGRNTKNNFLQKQKYFRGCRISTGEQNLTNQFSGEGAISRILEITLADIFDNDFAIEIHQFCADNFGHFGQEWINYIINNKADFRKYFADTEKDYRQYGLMSNHVTTFAACHTALLFFCKMLEIDANTIEKNLITDFCDFAGSGELPTKDRATNASRALQTVAETVASHPKFFKAEKYDSDTEELKLGNSDEGSAMYDYGFILKNGDVAIYPSALREILKDYPSVDALIRNFAECGYLECGTNEKRPYQKQAKYNGIPRWVYRFKKATLEN